MFITPLHSLRKTKVFQFLLQSKLNHPKLYDIGFNHRVALRPLTHVSIRWKRKRLEPGIRNLIIAISQQLDSQQEDGWFFDVGANIGLYSWEIRKNNPKRKILAFEPDPNNFELLQITAQEGRLKNLEISPKALNNRAEDVCFFQDTLTSATGTISKADKPWVERYLNGTSNKIIVQSKTMDSMIDEKKIPSLVKIDVEGHEVEVLEGAEKILSTKKPLLVIESFPPNREKTIGFLTLLGYNLLDADNTQPVDETTHNLFAWHPSGPIKDSIIRKIVSR